MIDGTTSAILALITFVAVTGALGTVLFSQHLAKRIVTKNAEIEEYRLRIVACIDAMREMQQANVTMGAAVREREESIAMLLQRVNEANVRLEGARQRLNAEYVYVRAGERIVGPFSRS